jgi:hypothetical protein
LLMRIRWFLLCCDGFWLFEGSSNKPRRLGTDCYSFMTKVLRFSKLSDHMPKQLRESAQKYCNLARGRVDSLFHGNWRWQENPGR